MDDEDLCLVCHGRADSHASYCVEAGWQRACRSAVRIEPREETHRGN